MKYFIIFLISMFLMSVASAETSVIEKIEHDEFDTTNIGSFLLCIDGYKWLYSKHYKTEMMNQFFIEKDSHAVPAK